MIASDLLLLHGTIYGEIKPEGPWIDCEFLTSNNDIDPHPIPSMPWLGTRQSHLVGVQAVDNHAVDVVHWTAGPGVTTLSGLEIWKLCLSVFLRHL